MHFNQASGKDFNWMKRRKCVRSSLWSFSALGCCRCCCDKCSEMIRKQELHEKGTKQKSFPEGMRVGGDARYVCPLHINNHPLLPWWSKTMLCRVLNEKTLHKGCITIKKQQQQKLHRTTKGVSLEVEMCVELLQQDHEEWWWIELNKRNRERVKEKQLEWGKNSKKAEIGQWEWRRTWKRRKRHWKWNLNNLQGSLWVWLKIEWGTSNKERENGWKTRSKIYGTGPNKWGRDGER